MKVKVLKEFRDKFNYSKLYKSGDEVDGFDKERVADLVGRGLVEVAGKQKTESADTAEAEKVEIVDAPKLKGRPKVNDR